MPGQLALVRHGQSEGNAQNVFTGWRDLPLTDRGRQEAHQVAAALQEMAFRPDAVFTSGLSRTIETAETIIADLALTIDVTPNIALNERDYGDLTGLNKDEAVRRFGADRVASWRRSFTDRPPHGESLEDAQKRILPYYQRMIRPALEAGWNVLVVAHGNTLRALVMALEGRSDSEIAGYEIATGEIVMPRLS